MLHEEGKHVRDTAIERIIAVLAGCVLALLITYIFLFKSKTSAKPAENNSQEAWTRAIIESKLAVRIAAKAKNTAKRKNSWRKNQSLSNFWNLNWYRGEIQSSDNN